MSGTSPANFDLEKLKESIRKDAASMRERAAESAPLAARGSAAWTFNWLEVKSRLKIGAGLARLGDTPLLRRYHGWKRRVALAASKVVLHLTRFITSRQTDCNHCILDVLHEMGEALHSVETRVVRQQEQIRLLEASLNQLQLRLCTGSARGELERKAS
jgi:hypothetical protein